MTPEKAQIRLYVTDHCPYCHHALKYLQSRQLPCEVISLEGNAELREKISRENGGWRTVPMIFVGDKFIGGYTDMMALVKSGEFERLLT